MNLRHASLLAIVAFAVGPTPADALSRSIALVSPNTRARTLVVRASDLRSAYLVRSGQVKYDASNLSPDGLRRQLQRHFDTVVALLLLNSSQSIELALDRLEAQQNETWSSAERREWRERLLASRRTQIVRLLEYRNRGLFPQNEGHSASPLPIFVDHHDTACAVGHLMRLSGRERDVAGIRQEDNLVYVPDLTSGPVIAWTVTSGLTLEEAALIQPAYGPSLLPKPDRALEVVGQGASFEFENLRYSNFRLFAGDDPAAPSVNIPVEHVACSWFGCGSIFPIIFDSDPVLDVTHLPDLELTLRNASPLALEESPPLLTSFARVVVQFDVEVTAPNLRIAHLPRGGSLMSNSYFDGNQFRLFVNESRDRLWIDQLHNPMPPCQDIICGGLRFPLDEFPLESIGILNPPDPQSANFEPTDRLTIVTEMYFPPEQEFRGQFVNFSLIAVPEPAAATLVLVTIGLCSAVSSRTRIG